MDELVQKLQNIIKKKNSLEAQQASLTKEIAELESSLVNYYGPDWATTMKNTADWVDNFGI